MPAGNEPRPPPGPDRQAALDVLFGAEAEYWSDLYAADDVLATVHRYRSALTLGWIDELGLPPATRVLEVGSGAGLLAVELARRGYHVEATDPVEEMRDRATLTAARAGLADRVHVSAADVHALALPDAAFPLVVGLGVLPWIDRTESALAELGRVLAPGGRLIVSINNRTPLHVMADPVRLPILAPIRDAARAALANARGVERGNGPSTRARPISFARPDDLARQLAPEGLRVVRSQAFGFGPFTLLGRPILPGRTGIELERRLQRRAESGQPILDALAAQYLVLAERGPA